MIDNAKLSADHENAISARSSRWAKRPLARAVLALAGLAMGAAFAADDAAGPAFVLDRTATLRWLEGSKAHKPRLPLPRPSAEDIQRGKSSPLGIVNNGLMRRNYLPPAWSSPSSSGLAGRQGKVDSAFKVELFWIASRLNQCAYCLGHQEVKLSSAGLTEDAIAALDGDWADADPATRAARLLAVHKTVAPQKPVPNEVLDALASRFDDAQVEEIILAVANYNAMNRWTGPLNIPQEDHREYAGRANEKTAGKVSKLVDKAREIAGTKRDLPTYEAWLAAVQGVSEAAPNPAEAFLNRQGEFGAGRLKSWRQALAETTPEDAVPARLRARIFWLCARLDNAPAAGAKARAAALALGDTDDTLRKIVEDADDARVTPAERKALELARKITLRPGAVADDDIAAVRAGWGDRATAQIVETASIAAAVNRCGK